MRKSLLIMVLVYLLAPGPVSRLLAQGGSAVFPSLDGVCRCLSIPDTPWYLAVLIAVVLLLLILIAVAVANAGRARRPSASTK